MGKKIYLADDEVSVRNLLVGILGRDENHDVSEFENGAELVRAYGSEKPDLVITDKDMPVMGGTGVIKYIRETAGDVETPIILVTGRLTEDVLDYVSAMPRTKILEKPFGMAELLRAVSESLV
jgi:DNA-binding response OmpR family regulator